MAIVLKPCCESMLVADLTKSGNIFICDHIGNKTTKIPKETVSDVRRTYNCSAERRDIRNWIIAICILESLDHIVCPVLTTSLVTVLNNDFECLAVLGRNTLEDLAEIVVEMSADMLLAHLVSLQSTSLFRRRAAFNTSCKHSSTGNNPCALRYIPCQGAVRSHIRCNVDYLCSLKHICIIIFRLIAPEIVIPHRKRIRVHLCKSLFSKELNLRLL